MSENETGLAQATVPPDALLMGSISIAHYMVEGDLKVAIQSQDASGEELRIVTILGLLETAKMFASHDHMEGTQFE